MNRAVLAILAIVLATPVEAYTPGSGDVDEDGRLTTRDAVLIVESFSWPEQARLFGFLEACDVNRDGACNHSDVDAIFSVTVISQADWDGDGVANDYDCAPLDHRLSSAHTYFVDIDRDQLGDPDRPVQVCSLVPYPPLALWGDDQFDGQPNPPPVIAPKGARLLGVDFGDPAQSGEARVDLAKELGVDATTLRLPWNTLESSPGVFTARLEQAMGHASWLSSTHGIKVSLSVSPISGLLLALPDDLRTAVETGAMRLNDERLTDRFKLMLSAVHARTGGVSLVSIQIGDEIDLFLARAPDYVWNDYADFLRAVVPHVRQLWPGVAIGTTATLSGLVVEPTAGRLKAINAATDVVSLTYLVHHDRFASFDPQDVRSHLGAVVAAYFPKRLFIQAAGYPSAASTGSSATRQSQFVTALFEAWDTWPALIPFVNFYRLHDYGPERAHWEGMLWGDVTSGPAYFETLGLRTYAEAGAAKSAYDTLRTLALNRGWSRMELPATRSFHMGFTPTPFDYTTPETYEQMITWVTDRLTTDGDIVNLHLDSGVPWVEALADTFASPELPYSETLRNRWAELRRRLPAGHKRLVSLNPLGVPRSVIAPYFGYGEGFNYAEDFRRVGTGAWADSDNRLPPSPWNLHRLNHPDVKAAFVNYCKRAIDFFQPDYLIVAIETTATMLEGVQAYDEFLELQRHVYATLKADPRYRHVPLLVSVSATSFTADEFGVPLKIEEWPGRKRELQVQGLRDLLPHVDMVAVSLYPHYGKYNSNRILGGMYQTLFRVLAEAGKPIGISESGWVAESFDLLGLPFVSDPQKQDLFYRHLFYEFGRAPVPVEFVVNFHVRDNDGVWAHYLAASQLDPPGVSPTFVEFYKYFRDIGIYDGGGAERLAGQTWKQMFARPFVPAN